LINLRQKRKAKVTIERAVAYIIAHPNATYASVSAQFHVSINQLRARINYRFGSLNNARTFGDARIRLWDRPCIACGNTDPRPHGLYRCETCRIEASKLHDGVV
jgi:hypothetical protein